VQFLGHTISASGVSPLAAHVAAITSSPRPSTLKELLRFLGIVNFYCRFLPAASRNLKPLTEATAGNPPPTLNWRPEMEQAFQGIKAALVAAVPLCHPLPNAQLALATDASNTHVRGSFSSGRQPLVAPRIFLPQTHRQAKVLHF
jgi:hypothetical protein